jgi:hypothetical protein
MVKWDYTCAVELHGPKQGISNQANAGLDCRQTTNLHRGGLPCEVSYMLCPVLLWHMVTFSMVAP